MLTKRITDGLLALLGLIVSDKMNWFTWRDLAQRTILEKAHTAVARSGSSHKAAYR